MDVHSAHLFDLPPELRSLVKLFRNDSRPSALVQGGEEHDALAYANSAFGALDVSEQQFLDALRGASRDEEQDDGEVLLDGRRWAWTRILDRWISVVRVKDTHDGTVYGNGTLKGGRVEEDNHTEGVRHAVTAIQERGPQLDWTRYDLPDLSPWTSFVKNFDFSQTPLGPISQWPTELRTVVVYLLNNPHPRIVMWGESMIVLYNEACIPIVGLKHPACFGKPVTEYFADIWAEVGPLIEKASLGERITVTHTPLMMARDYGFEESFFDFSLNPIMGPGGRTCGIFDELSDVTQVVRGERRRQSTLLMTKLMAAANSLDDLWSALLHGLDSAGVDVPFAVVYGASEQDGRDELMANYNFKGSIGIQLEMVQTLKDVVNDEVSGSMNTILSACFKALKSKSEVFLSSQSGNLHQVFRRTVPERTFGGDAVRNAIVYPILSSSGNKVYGVLIMGLCPRIPWDEEYSLWSHLIADVLTKSANLISLPEEQRHALKLADDINRSLMQQLRITTLQAERSEARFNQMAESTPMGMFYFSNDGVPMQVNEAYLRLLGVDRIQDVQATWQEKIHPDDLASVQECWMTITEQIRPATVEYRLKQPWQSIDKATGQSLSGDTWIQANGIPEVDTEGKVTAIQGWLIDISHRKFSEKLLAQRLEEALENKRQTENFIDMTSHEMRNPLSAILQSADAIMTAFPPVNRRNTSEYVTVSAKVIDEVADAAETIVLCAQHQKRIVDDILTLSKLDASLLVISPDQVQPPALVAKALKMYESEIARAKIHASMGIDQSYSDLEIDHVVVDSSRLLQVIINTLSNAIKFTQYSDVRTIRISLGASRERPTGKEDHVKFVPGLSSRQVDMSDPEWGQGEELYLQVAVIDSGRGLSEDEMKVLFQRFAQASPKTYKQYGGSGLGLYISRELCELQGGQIGVSSGNGQTTFSFFVRARRWVADANSDSVQQPSAKSPSASESPIIFERRGNRLSTGSMQENPSEKRLDYTVRPDSSPSIPVTTAASLFSPALPTADVDNGLHVLICEDNNTNQRVMSQQLRRAGCTVYVASHGLECLTFLEQSTFSGAATPLSVILLDLEMPIMDGLTCVRHIREQQAEGKLKAHVPVIAVTANARSEQISAALAAGMDRVVTKPFRIGELLPQMQKLVEEVGGRGNG